MTGPLIIVLVLNLTAASVNAYAAFYYRKKGLDFMSDACRFFSVCGLVAVFEIIKYLL